MRASLRFVCVLACVGCVLAALPVPSPAILHAPFTPFHDDSARSVNLDVIPTLAAGAKAAGVNVVWTCGGLGQFDTLSVSERKALTKAWIAAGHAHGLFIIAHVGTDVLADAIELARQAVADGADAIASVPPYYSDGGMSAWEVAQYLQQIAAAAPSLPFFYYHIPAATGSHIAMADFIPAVAQLIPSFGGVKYVSGDFNDWLAVTQVYTNYTFMWAPEPKLTAIPLGAKSVVLAEDFFAPSWLRMQQAFWKGDMAGALKEQLWKLNVAKVFSTYGDGFAERYVYKNLLNVTMGPARWPGQPMSAESYDAMVAALDALDFWTLAKQ